MSTIDWSKAPEGATHYMTPPSSSPWRDLSGKTWKWWDEQVGWKDSEESSKAFFGRRHDRLIPYPELWNGEGLPPVGADVEIRYAIEEFSVWHKATCVAIGQAPEGEQICVTRSEDGVVAVYRSVAHIRPARTADQIAAEEREKARDEVLNAMAEKMALEKNETLWQHRLLVVGEMLDMGYRKQVTP